MTETQFIATIIDITIKFAVAILMILVGLGKISFYKDEEKQAAFMYKRAKWFLWPGLFLLVLKLTDLLTK